MVTYEGYQKYTLSCTVQSNPESNITWYMGVKEITALGSNSEYDMEQKVLSQNDKFTKIRSTLTFKNVTRYYNGFWTCTAVNEILGKLERNTNKTSLLIVTCMRFCLCCCFLSGRNLSYYREKNKNSELAKMACQTS